MSKRFEELVNQMQKVAAEELQAANSKFPAFSGKHEGFAENAGRAGRNDRGM